MTTLAIALALLLAVTAVVPTGPAPPALHLRAAPGRSIEPLRPVAVPGRASPVDARHLAGGAQGRLLVTTTDPLAMPNDGLRLNATPFSEPPLGPDASFQASVEETIGAYDAVFGLFTNTGTAPIPFFSVFSNTTDANVHLAYWPTATTAPGSTYDFELAQANGTVWELKVNHAIFGGNASAGEFDFGAARSTWLPGLSFSEIALYASTTSAPMTLSTSLAFAVLEPAGWYLPTEAQETFSPAGGPAWGIEGRLQHPTLAPGELVSGTSLAPVPNGTVLWTGGRVPVNVALGLPTEAQGLSAVAVSVAVTTTSGAPVPGATVFLSDEYDGNFTPASALTGPGASVSVAFSTPNVTANVSDLLSAVVTTFGYEGFTGLALSLFPAVHVVVRSLSGAPTVGPAGSIALTFATATTSGAPLPSVYLAFGTTGGTLSPEFGLTGSDATLTTTLTAPNTTGYLTVRAVVGSGGEWGDASVNITVRPATPPLLSAAEIEAAVGVVLAALVVAFVVV
ncbi:MAG TPA: hypothetical protein VN864_06615, partial [Thermoplasmata archaeon]|nr:hypothetical protein [Thermoplasmata archaeon]